MNDITKTPVPEGYMQDAQGRLVPEELVKDIDKARNDLVLEIVGHAAVLSNRIANFKSAVMGDIAAFVELSAEQYGAKLGGKKGNVSLLSYDGKFKVQRSIGNKESFNEGLLAAKSLIDECLNEWTSDSRPEIRLIIQSAFKTDKGGQIDMQKVRDLRHLDIQNEKWQRAMQGIADSIVVHGTTTYLLVYERVGDTDQWRQIPLQISAL